jgi:polyisoprenoid-binding protein YceI
MSADRKRWLIAGFIVVDVIIVVLVLAWVFRDPYRASQAQQAQVSEARATEQIDATAEGLQVIPFETAELMFTGSSALGEQPGFFEQVSGEVGLAPDETLRSVRATVRMSSVVTNADSLTKKLKEEPGFFEAEKYPTAEFVSTQIRPAPEGAVRETHVIVGNLTLRGVTKSVEFPAQVEISADRFLLSAEFSVNRHDFGVSYDGGAAFPEIRELVLINLSIDAARQRSLADEPTNNTTEP